MGIMERRRTVRKIFIVLLALIAAVWLLFAVAGALLFAAERAEMKENIQIHTETEPIYNHFPDLPETSEMQWCSKSSEGIGLTTTTVYIFSFYNHDISNELQEMDIKNESEDIELHFTPDGINEEQKWRRVENAKYAFQTGIKDTSKMYTTVYINDAGTILYIEAIGD